MDRIPSPPRREGKNDRQFRFFSYRDSLVFFNTVNALAALGHPA